MVQSMTTPFGYYNSETPHIYFVEFYINIKSLLNRFIYSTAILSFHFSSRL